MVQSEFINNPFGMTQDVNGKPIPNWQQHLENLYLVQAPFGEELGYVRHILAVNACSSLYPDVLEILRIVTDELEAYIRSGYSDTLDYPVNQLRLERDLSTVRRARAMISELNGG